MFQTNSIKFAYILSHNMIFYIALCYLFKTFIKSHPIYNIYNLVIVFLLVIFWWCIFCVAVVVESNPSDEGVLEKYLTLGDGIWDISFLLTSDYLRESSVVSSPSRLSSNPSFRWFSLLHS